MRAVLGLSDSSFQVYLMALPLVEKYLRLNVFFNYDGVPLGTIISSLNLIKTSPFLLTSSIYAGSSILSFLLLLLKEPFLNNSSRISGFITAGGLSLTYPSSSGVVSIGTAIFPSTITLKL